MSQSNDQNFLESSIKLFRYHKKLGEGAIAQLNDEEVLRKPNELSNSIALIVHHLSGNMLSRWTDFLTSDGENLGAIAKQSLKKHTPIKQRCWMHGKKAGSV
jgi:hypothetical protein